MDHEWQNPGLRTALEGIERAAFFAGFRRSDNPPPPDERVEAAYQYWKAHP